MGLQFGGMCTPRVINRTILGSLDHQRKLINWMAGIEHVNGSAALLISALWARLRAQCAELAHLPGGGGQGPQQAGHGVELVDLGQIVHISGQNGLQGLRGPSAGSGQAGDLHPPFS